MAYFYIDNPENNEPPTFVMMQFLLCLIYVKFRVNPYRINSIWHNQT